MFCPSAYRGCCRWRSRPIIQITVICLLRNGGPMLCLSAANEVDESPGSPRFADSVSNVGVPKFPVSRRSRRYPGIPGDHRVTGTATRSEIGHPYHRLLPAGAAPTHSSTGTRRKLWDLPRLRCSPDVVPITRTTHGGIVGGGLAPVGRFGCSSIWCRTENQPSISLIVVAPWRCAVVDIVGGRTFAGAALHSVGEHVSENRDTAARCAEKGHHHTLETSRTRRPGAI